MASASSLPGKASPIQSPRGNLNHIVKAWACQQPRKGLTYLFCTQVLRLTPPAAGSRVCRKGHCAPLAHLPVFTQNLQTDTCGPVTLAACAAGPSVLAAAMPEAVSTPSAAGIHEGSPADCVLSACCCCCCCAVERPSCWACSAGVCCCWGVCAC